MAEKIDMLDRAAAGILLMNAAVEAGGDDMFDKFKINLRGPDVNIVEVELFINGVKCPYADTINKYWREFDKLVEEEAKHQVKKMLEDLELTFIKDTLDTAAQRLQDEISSAAWKIEHAVNAWKPKKENQ